MFNQKSQNAISEELQNSNNILKKRNKSLSAKNKILKQKLEDLKQFQGQFFQNSKMVSIGLLAAGVAHEINNPISYVANNLRTLKRYLSALKEILEMRQNFYNQVINNMTKEIKIDKFRLSEIEASKNINLMVADIDNLITESSEGIHQVADIVIALRSFARNSKTELKKTSINDCIEIALKILSNELKYKCEVIKEFSELPLIQCNPGQMYQLFTNLILNACQSIKNPQGTITIKTFVEDEFICIAIIDTGCGISKQNLGAIFEPFFTTKSMDVGIGLGLSVSYAIIQNHKGYIDVKSTVNEGSTFLIKLPLQ